MTKKQLQNIISQGENEQVEFKLSFNKQAIETVVSFSNNKGGKLYVDLTVEDLKTDNYQAQSRNKLITGAFYLTKDIEKYGSGYRRIREQIAKYPTMFFNFEESSGGYLVKVGYENQKTDNVTDNVTDNQRNIKIIELIKINNKISSAEMAEILDVTKRTILRDIEKLKNKVK